MTSPAAALLRIQEQETVSDLIAFLKKVYAESFTNGILLGLSGGIDSTLLAVLAVRLLGKEAVHAAYLFDRDSSIALGRAARGVAAWLGVSFTPVTIDQMMEERGVYAPASMRTTASSAWLNRLLHWAYCRAFGETPFITSLRAGSARQTNQRLEISQFQEMALQVEAGLNARHIHRRQLLEEMAATSNWLLLGAANRSEWLTGWFVRGGVDDLPIQPLKGLYKTQVRQLAAHLGIPEVIISQPPSPDMRRGVTDELALGVPYEHVDLVLDHLAGGVSGEQLREAGIAEREVERVREMSRLSWWKRGADFQPYPVDGGPSGGFRMNGKAA